MDIKEGNVFVILIIILSMLIVIVSYFVVSILRIHKKQKLFDQQLLALQVHTLEDERKRIAADLHDNVGPMLSAIKHNINVLDVAGKQNEKQIALASRNIDEAIQELRNISFNLIPNTLAIKGLVSAIRTYINKYYSAASFHIELEMPQQLALAHDKALHVYRIVQEILHNTAKHAECKNFSLTITIDKDTIILHTKDDGAGFESSMIKEQAGQGLKNIEVRSRLLAATLQITSAPLRGTAITVNIPNSNNETHI